MFSLRKSGLIVAAIALASLAGCGRYGPLYLPERPQPGSTAQAGEPTSQNPSPSRSPSRPQSSSQDKMQDRDQDSEFNAQPPALDTSRQP